MFVTRIKNALAALLALLGIGPVVCLSTNPVAVARVKPPRAKEDGPDCEPP
jgi:hypothetical protein